MGGISAPRTPFEVRRRALGFRQQQLVDMVRIWNEQRGKSPSYQEIAEALGLDGNGHVCNIARRCEEAGYLKREGECLKGRGRGKRGPDTRLRLA